MSKPSDIRRLQGTQDLLPSESQRWSRLENTVRTVMKRFDFGELRSPIIEPTELFDRGTGSSTDIVQKEMYTFTDRGARSLTLRPEGTPSVVRAYLEASLGAQRPVWKFYYIGPMFRAERPQRGRFRQFHQFGAEMIGASAPNADIELIALKYNILNELGIDDARLVLNSIGSPAARSAHNAALRNFLEKKPIEGDGALCENCRRRAAINPLRIFDCKKGHCQGLLTDAPTIDQYLTAEDQEHFRFVRQGLEQLGIGFDVDVRMVRGLDYYTRTTFEFLTDRIGSQDALGGGGRYDLLVETLGGPATPAVGFASGIERILDVMESAGISDDAGERLDVFVCPLGAQACERLPSLLQGLRSLGVSADADFLGRGLKGQMKEANRQRARYALLVGDDEIARGQYTLKPMDKGDQVTITADTANWTADLFTGP